MTMDPDVVLRDESSMGLAPILVDEVFKTIASLRSAGVTMLLVEQFQAATEPARTGPPAWASSAG